MLEEDLVTEKVYITIWRDDNAIHSQSFLYCSVELS